MMSQRPLRASVSSLAKQGHRSASLPGWHEAEVSQHPRSAQQGRASDTCREWGAEARAWAGRPGRHHVPDLGRLAQCEPTWPWSWLRDQPRLSGEALACISQHSAGPAV